MWAVSSKNVFPRVFEGDTNNFKNFKRNYLYLFVINLNKFQGK